MPRVYRAEQNLPSRLSMITGPQLLSSRMTATTVSAGCHFQARMILANEDD
jgi:hypothetical protein